VVVDGGMGVVGGGSKRGSRPMVWRKKGVVAVVVEMVD
jgi:hypothetical protein